jgi:purine-binding chemotaxis protein CheW
MMAEALVVIVAGTRCALPMERVLEVRVYEGATRVPGAPDWVRGIVDREGVPVELIDAARRLDATSATHAPDASRSCVVFFESAAVLVDDVDGLVSVDALDEYCSLIDVDALFGKANA